MRKIQDVIIRFFKHVIKGNNDECWLWKGAKNPAGYGRFGLPGNKRIYAHRFSYELIYGKIPDKLYVCHHCDKPSCVNPKHLWVGTHQENMKDMVKKGRNCSERKGNKFGKFSIILKGSLHPLAKLNKEKVKEIKVKIKNGIRGNVIAAQYNVSDQLIYDIKNGISWKHVII
jgi:hypothetical protein